MVATTAPANARFVSVDPAPPDAQSGSNFNRYAYAANNPHRYVDPDGRLPIAIPIVMGIGWMLTSGHANAPAPGGATYSTSAGDAFEGFSGALPAGRAVGLGRAITFGVAPVYGNPQVTRSGGKETTHAPTSQRVANENAERNDAGSVHMNQTLTTITGGTITASVRPDVAVVRTDGKVDVTEVLSPRQNASDTVKKYQDALGEMAGSITCVQMDHC
nr:RHS repeat-associated core domain-containing protein [Lysobacter lactosilyticus]